MSTLRRLFLRETYQKMTYVSEYLYLLCEDKILTKKAGCEKFQDCKHPYQYNVRANKQSN